MARIYKEVDEENQSMYSSMDIKEYWVGLKTIFTFAITIRL